MDETGFKVEGLDNLNKVLAGVVNRFPDEKEKETLKIAYICLREIKLLVPVDSGRLRASLTFGAGSTQSQEHEGKSEGGIDKTPDSVEFGTNVNYALDIEDGHEVKQRFVPKEALEKSGGKNWEKMNISTSIESQVGATSYVNDTAKLPITDPRVKGFTTHPQFVLGIHYFARGMQNSESKTQAELEKWVQRMMENIEKSNQDIAATFEDL